MGVVGGVVGEVGGAMGHLGGAAKAKSPVPYSKSNTCWELSWPPGELTGKRRSECLSYGLSGSGFWIFFRHSEITVGHILFHYQ